MTPNAPIAHLAMPQRPQRSQWRVEEGLTLAVAGRRFGLTPRAIRHYEEHELVRPSRDSRGRRVFDDVQCARLELIAALRNADVPLGEVGRVLATADPQRSRAIALTVLERRLQQIQISQACAIAALDWLKALDGPLTPPTMQPTT